MFKPSTLIRLAAVGVAVTAIAACTPRPATDTGAGNNVPPPTGPQYPPVNNGGVDGGNLVTQPCKIGRQDGRGDADGSRGHEGCLARGGARHCHIV